MSKGSLRIVGNCCTVLIAIEPIKIHKHVYESNMGAHKSLLKERNLPDFRKSSYWPCLTIIPQSFRVTLQDHTNARLFFRSFSSLIPGPSCLLMSSEPLGVYVLRCPANRAEHDVYSAGKVSRSAIKLNAIASMQMSDCPCTGILAGGASLGCWLGPTHHPRRHSKSNI